MALFKKPRSPFYWYDLRMDGKRYRGSTGEKTKAAAGTFEARMLLKLKAGTKPEMSGKTYTLRELGDQFLLYFDQHQQRDEDTKRTYRFGMKHLMDTKLADMPLDRITTTVISTVSFPHSASTGNAALRTLSRMLRQAVEWEMLAAAPRIHLFKEIGRDATFTAEDERKLLKVAKRPFREFFIILMDTGMRPSELCRLQWEHVYWDRNTIFVASGKTSAARRHIAMSERVRDALRDLAAEGLSTTWVFVSRCGRTKGKPVGSYAEAFRDARDAAGLSKKLVMYSARHTFGTDLAAHTGNQKLLMETMGHTELKTSGRYQHPDTLKVGSVMDLRNEQRKNEKSMITLASGHTLSHTTPSVN